MSEESKIDRMDEAQDPKGNPAGREPLATPFELALIAISLAALKGEMKPDLTGAVELLREAESRGRDEKLRGRIFAPGVMVEDEDHAQRMRELNKHIPGYVVKSPISHPDEWREAIDKQKRFPGSNLISPPRKYPATQRAFWRAMLGTNPDSKKRARALGRLPPEITAGFIGEDGGNITSEVGFWMLAGHVAPFLPRFSGFYPDAPAKRPKQKRAKDGKYSKSKRDANTGQFKKK